MCLTPGNNALSHRRTNTRQGLQLLSGGGVNVHRGRAFLCAPRSGQRACRLGLSTTLRCTIRRVTLTCIRCAAIGLNLRWSSRLTTMRHINLHPITQRTGKVHAIQISIRGGTGGGGNRIHGTTLSGQCVYAGVVHGTRDVHPHGSLTGGAALSGFTRVSARLGGGLGTGLSSGALLGTHRMRRLGGSTRGGKLLGTRRR